MDVKIGYNSGSGRRPTSPPAADIFRFIYFDSWTSAHTGPGGAQGDSAPPGGEWSIG